MQLKQVETAIQKYGENFQDWIEKQDLSEKEEQIWLFHHWMRQETQLSSGSIVDYRKYVAQYLNEDGELMKLEGQTMTNHKSAAINKFKDFKSSEDFTNKGDDL